MSSGNSFRIGRAALRGGALLLAAGLALGLLGGLALALLTKPLYRASATLLVEQYRPLALDYPSTISGDRLAKTYAALLQASPILSATIAALNLNADPDALSRHVKATVVRDTQLIALTVDDPAPEQARRIAAEMLAQFSKANDARESGRFSPAEAQLADQLEALNAQAQANATQVSGSVDAAERTRLEALGAGYQDTINSLRDKLAGVQAAAAQPLVTISIVDPPQASRDPVSPDTLAYLLAGAALGLLVSGGFLVVRYHLEPEPVAPVAAAAPAPAKRRR